MENEEKPELTPLQENVNIAFTYFCLAIFAVVSIIVIDSWSLFWTITKLVFVLSPYIVLAYFSCVALYFLFHAVVFKNNVLRNFIAFSVMISTFIITGWVTFFPWLEFVRDLIGINS